MNLAPSPLLPLKNPRTEELPNFPQLFSVQGKKKPKKTQKIIPKKNLFKRFKRGFLERGKKKTERKRSNCVF